MMGRLTGFTTASVGGVLVGDLNAGHILRFGVQPDITLVFGTDTGEGGGIGGFQTNTSVVGATEGAAGARDGFESTGVIDILD
jgi:hypothetical protein